MYRLESFADGKAVVVDDAAPYHSTFVAATIDEATAIVAGLNGPYVLAGLAAHRYAVETAGITVDGVAIATDRGSQAMLGGALQALTSNFVSSVNWKSPTSWTSMTLAQITPMATAVAIHVQACFTAEMQVHAQIVASPTPIDVVAAFDTALAAIKAGAPA